MTNNVQYEKYETLARFILPNISSNIHTTYEKYIKERDAENYIYENYIAGTKPSTTDALPYPMTPFSLQDMIVTCTYIALSKESIEQALRTCREIRRITKRNWFNSIKEEIYSPDNMKPKNPQFLRNYAKSKKLINSTNRDTISELTIEEIMMDKYKDIDNWRSDTSAPATNFFFLSEKPTKTLANGFINDLTFESLLTIRDEFNDSIEGFNTKYPTIFSNKPIFSFRNTAMDFEAKLIENELSFLNKYQFEGEDTEGDIIVNYNPDTELPAISNKKDLSNVLKNFQIDLKQKELDMKDREIMTQLFNRISGENISIQKITVDLRDFIRKVYNVNVPRQKHYDDLDMRLKRLQNYNYSIAVRKKDTGELIESTTLGLLNYIHINYEENYFQFTPSDEWIRTYIEKKYISILTDSYTSITSAQTRGIMMLLQQERLTEHTQKSSSKTLTLKYFRSNMKLIKMGNATLLKELTTHLKTLQDKQIIIKNFEITNQKSAISIDFLPLNSNELIAYEFTSKELVDNSQILDVDCIDVSDKIDVEP